MGANSEYYTEIDTEIADYVTGVLRKPAQELRDSAEALRLLLHRPERIVHEQTIAWQLRAAQRMEQLADAAEQVFAAADNGLALDLAAIAAAAFADGYTAALDDTAALTDHTTPKEG